MCKSATHARRRFTTPQPSTSYHKKLVWLTDEVSLPVLRRQKVSIISTRQLGHCLCICIVRTELQWWSAAADALKQISSEKDAAETIGRVNRLLSAWPQDDVLPAEGYDSVKGLYRKVNTGLKEIKDSAERDVKYVRLSH